MTAILKIKNLFVFICFILCLLPAAQVHAGSDLAGTIILVDFYSDKVSEYIDAGDNDSAEASLYYLQKHIKNLELYKEVKDLTVDNTGLITTRLEKYENILNDLADIRYSSPDNSDGNYKNNKGQDKFSVSYLDTVYSNSQSSIIQAGFVYNPVKGVKGNSVIQYSDGNFKNLYYQFDNQINVNEQKVNIDISGMAFHHDPYSDYVNLNLHSRNDIKLYGFSNFRLYSGIQSQFSQNSNDNFYLLTLSGYENQPEGGLEFTYRLNKASKTTSSYHHLGFGLDRPDQFEFFDYIYGYNCNISTWLFPDDDIRNSCIFSYKQNLKKRFSSIDSEVYVYYQLQRSSDSYVGLFNQYNLFYNKGLDFMRLNMDMEYYPGSDADYIRLGLNKSLPGLDKPESNISHSIAIDYYTYENPVNSFYSLSYLVNSKSFLIDALFPDMFFEAGRRSYTQTSNSSWSVKLIDYGLFNPGLPMLRRVFVQYVWFDNKTKVLSDYFIVNFDLSVDTVSLREGKAWQPYVNLSYSVYTQDSVQDIFNVMLGVRYLFSR